MGEQNLHRLKAVSGTGELKMGSLGEGGKLPELYGAPGCISRRGLDESFPAASVGR